MPAEFAGEGAECLRCQESILKLSQGDPSLGEGILEWLDQHLARCYPCRAQLEKGDREGAQGVLQRANLPRFQPPASPPQEGESPLQLADALALAITAGRGWLLAPVARLATAIALVFLCVGIIAVLGVNVTRLSATAAQLETDSTAKDGKIQEQADRLRSTQARLDSLETAIKAVGLANPVTLQDLGAATIVEPARNRLRFAGSYNPVFIKEVRFRWGVEPDASLSPLGKDDLSISPGDGRAYFDKESPELRLQNQMAVAVLEFVPRPDMARRFPEYFTPERMQYRRNFFLGRGGIEADIEPAAILEPGEGAEVSQTDPVTGKVRIDGWPVVCVRALNEGESWWVQPAVGQLDDERRFSIRCHFGQQGSPPGTKFRVVILVAPTRQEAERFRAGQQFTSLPVGLPKSMAVTVIRQ
jgi:hypothetical protein